MRGERKHPSWQEPGAPGGRSPRQTARCRGAAAVLTGAAAAASLALACSSPPAVAPAATSAQSAGAPLPLAATSAAPAASATAAVEAAPASRFRVVAALDGEVRLLPIEDAVLVAHTAARAAPDSTDRQPKSYNPIGLLRGDALTYPKNLELSGWAHGFVDATGRWPDDVHLLVTGSDGRTGIAEYHALTDKGWSLRTTPCGRANCVGTGSGFAGVERVGDSLVALKISLQWPLAGAPPEMSTLRGSAKLKLSPAPAGCKSAWNEEYGRKPITAVYPFFFGSARDGTLLAVGIGCGDETAVEVWKPGAAVSTVLPAKAVASFDVDIDSGRVVPGAGDQEAYLLVGSILRYDGKVLEQVPPPAPGVTVAAGGVTSDGALWVIAKQPKTPGSGPGQAPSPAKPAELARWDGKVWSREKLPSDLAPTDLAIGSDGTLWVATASALLRLKKAGEDDGKVALPAAAATADATPAPPKRAVRPGSARCAQNLVILYGFTKVTADDYDFPLTRKAIQGHFELAGVRYVVTRDHGKKYFAALVPSFDLGKKLVKVIEQGVKDAKPQIVCAEPEIVRELKIDLGTGAVLK